MPTPSITFTEQQKTAYRAIIAPKATDEQWLFFIAECERRALIPGVHVVFQVRKSDEWDKQLQRNVTVDKVTLITTINALRLIADRSGSFRGYGRFTYYYGNDADEFKPTHTSSIPLGKVPHAVSVELFRDGWPHPVFSVARYDACVQHKSDRTTVTSMWHKRGEEQLAKCAEANGLRMVAPEECGGLYIEEEMGQHDTETSVVSDTPAAVETMPMATVAPAINQAPAEVATPAPAVVEPIIPAPAVSAPAPPKLGPPKPPARPAPPKPATPVPPVATPVPAPIPSNPVPNRVPQPEGVAQESHAELENVADRVARDKDPVVPAPAPAAVAPAPTGEQPATATEYQHFMNRAAKVSRDKLENAGKLKNAGTFLKDYLIKQSGQQKLNKISAAIFEELISALEKATPEEAVKIVQAAKA